MLAEFTIIEDPLRPCVGTNLCAVCFRHERYEGKGIGCCSYEPEFCLFDLVYLFLNYPDIYKSLGEKGRIFAGYNGVMVEMATGLKQCPFAGAAGCSLPLDALTPLCRLFLCREAAVFAPAKFEERFDTYFTSVEYELNQELNARLPREFNLTWPSLHSFIVEAAPAVSREIEGIDRENPAVERFSIEIELADFGRIP